ncbi:MAG: squalene/phytoene synthase family protein, partial [Burkholderiaceae bacterium]|nr:squalene/phytoene synthase family protein [Burkholderiaceae bacterium]
ALFGSLNADTEALSDEICTALQLINFLQDLAIDWSRGRLYLPLDELGAACLDEESIRSAVESGSAPIALREFIASQSRRCAKMLERGAPLVARVPARLGWELRAIRAGAHRVLERLAANGYDPIARRPKLGWRDTPSLLRLMLADPAAR